MVSLWYASRQKKSRGQEELCLMGYTDQLRITSGQHLTLAVCCCVSYVVPFRIIKDTHLCDLAALKKCKKKKILRV